MNTLNGILKSAKQKITYHLDYIALSLVIMGCSVIDLLGVLTGWALSTRCVIGAVLITGGCYLATWTTNDNKALLFFSGFLTALLLFVLVLKFNSNWVHL